MRTPPINTPLDGALVHPVRTDADQDAAMELMTDLSQRVAFDVETTGVGFHDELRLVQFSNCTDAYVFEPHRFPELTQRLAVRPNRCAHNMRFDGHHLSKATGINIAKVLEGVIDTLVLSRIENPSDKRDGGTGHGLKDLAKKWVDTNAPDGDAALMAEFKALGYTRTTGWALIDIANLVYVMYAGLDTILTNRLVEPLMDRITRNKTQHLIEFDHKVEIINAKMRQKGIAVDEGYTSQLAIQLVEERDTNMAVAAALGVENINSPKQVADGLQIRGCALSEKTEKGQLKVDKVVLNGLDDDLARAIISAKSASKALTGWVDPFLAHAAHDGRVHCNIKTGSITYRLSASEPNLMNLPAGDWRIRRCLVPDPGHQFITSDFAQVELRTVAAIAKEDRMIEVFLAGGDLHDATAARLFGDDFTDAQRKLAKNTSFGVLYSGGPDTLARQAGVTRLEARKAIDRFYRAYPRIRRWSNELITQIKERRPLVVTHTGRRIPVDHRFAYRATNYAVQSLACDIFRDSLIKLDEAGIDILLPIHDEVLVQAPEEDAEDVAAEVARIMTGDLDGVPITADSQVIGPSWGHAYGAPEVLHV